MNAVQLTALLGSFAFGVAFMLVSTWPRRVKEPALGPTVTWPSQLDPEARLGIAVELAARLNAERLAVLQQARLEEKDPRILAVLDRALAPVIGEPQ